MSDTCRLWLVVRGEDEQRIASATELFASVPLAAVVSSGDQIAGRVASRIRTAPAAGVQIDARLHGRESFPPQDSRSDPLTVLDAWAEKHAGEQIAMVCEPTLARSALTRALELPAESIDRFELLDATVIALDWPARSAELARPSLAGFALDWIPIWNPRATRRFPGGPGSAPPSRP